MSRRARASRPRFAARDCCPVEEARDHVLSKVQTLAPLELPLTDAYGCVPARDIVATIDLPEFASSAMDGFAVRAADVDAAPRRCRRPS